MAIRDAVEAEYREYEKLGIIDDKPENRAFHVQMATIRALTHFALSSLSPELLKDVNIEEGLIPRDILSDNHEGRVYFQGVVPRLTPEQLGQLITYNVLRPVTMIGAPGRLFVKIYDEESGGFRIEELPSADSIEPSPERPAV